MTTNTVTFDVKNMNLPSSPEEQREQLVDRLYKAGHINLTEAITLMSPKVEYFPQTIPYTGPVTSPGIVINPGTTNPYTTPSYPGTTQPWTGGPTITYTTTN